MCIRDRPKVKLEAALDATKLAAQAKAVSEKALAQTGGTGIASKGMKAAFEQLDKLELKLQSLRSNSLAALLSVSYTHLVRMVVTPESSSVFAAFSQTLRASARVTGLLIKKEASLAASVSFFFGAPVEGRCRCRLMRPGIRYLPHRSTTCLLYTSRCV